MREILTDDERKRRQERVAAVGVLAWGADWQTPMADALGYGRVRVAQWMLKPSDKKEKNVPAKPVPTRVMQALPAIARTAAADLRRRADELDALAAEEGAPPGAQGEPEANGEPPQESGPAAAEAAGEEEVDLDALVALACSTPSPYARAPEPPPERTGWRTDYADARTYRGRPVLASPVIPDEREFLAG